MHHSPPFYPHNFPVGQIRLRESIIEVRSWKEFDGGVVLEFHGIWVNHLNRDSGRQLSKSISDDRAREYLSWKIHSFSFYPAFSFSTETQVAHNTIKATDIANTPQLL